MAAVGAVGLAGARAAAQTAAAVGPRLTGAGVDPSTLPVLQVPVIRRQGWGARPPQAPMKRHRPKRLTLHHTAVVLGDDRLSPSRLRRHQNWHMDDPAHNNPDLAYHFMVDMQGNIFEGRDFRYRGDTATEYDPTGHFLVCCEGDFDQQEPTSQQLDSVAALFAWAAQRWRIKPKLVAGHQDYASTTCPGRALEALVKDRSLRKKVRRLVKKNDVRLKYMSPARSRRVVLGIEGDVTPDPYGGPTPPAA